MSRPHLLLVDDSDAILAYETAALAPHYATSTAKTGEEALLRLRQLRPAAVLLDLSMPEMDGDEVLRRMMATPAYADIPVIIVSSETSRGDACLRAGAAAFLPKPIRAEALRATVERVLEATRQQKRDEGLAVLFVGVGRLELGIPLENVLLVALMPETIRLPAESGPVREMIDLRGEPVCVLDLARGLGVEHAVALEDRKLVVVAHDALRLALCVDVVREPAVVAAEEFSPRASIGGAEHEPLKGTLLGIARTERAKLPVVDPVAMFSSDVLAALAEATKLTAETR